MWTLSSSWHGEEQGKFIGENSLPELASHLSSGLVRARGTHKRGAGGAYKGVGAGDSSWIETGGICQLQEPLNEVHKKLVDV